MKEFADEEKYTTLEQSKILEPIMCRLGVEADGFWDYFEVDGIGLPVDCAVTVNEGWFVNHGDINDCKLCDPDDCQVCYRLDTLLWVLPDWVIFDIDLKVEQRKFKCKHTDLFNNLKYTKGKEVIASAVELIKLLNEENFLETQK